MSPGAGASPPWVVRAVLAAASFVALPTLAEGTFKDCRDCPTMVSVPSGSFLMGSAAGAGQPDEFVFDDGLPEPVRFDRPFAVAATEVTVGQFRAFVRATGYQSTAEKRTGCSPFLPGGYHVRDRAWTWRSPGYVQSESHPVVCVSWHDALAYTRWLATRTGRPYRLPSEAEFEFLMREAGSDEWGAADRPQALCRVANLAGMELSARLPGLETAPCVDRHVTPAAVGQYPATPRGGHDLQGNVREWVADCYQTQHGLFAPQQQGGRRLVNTGQARTRGCDMPLRRVVRGGSWIDDPPHARVAARGADEPSQRYNYVGFRVALDLGTPVVARSAR